MKIRQVINRIADIVTIVCPLVIGIAGGLQASGIISLLDIAGGLIACILGVLSTIASVVYNVSVNVKKEFDKEAA